MPFMLAIGCLASDVGYLAKVDIESASAEVPVFTTIIIFTYWMIEGR